MVLRWFHLSGADLNISWVSVGSFMSYFSKRFIVLCITVNLKDVQRIVKFMIDDQKIERIKNNTKGVDKLVAGGGH